MMKEFYFFRLYRPDGAGTVVESNLKMRGVNATTMSKGELWL